MIPLLCILLGTIHMVGAKSRSTTTTSSHPVHTTGSTTSTAVLKHKDDPYGASDMMSPELIDLMQHDGDYYLHGDSKSSDLARCELLIVNADTQVSSYDTFEKMAILTDHNIPVNNLQSAVCMRFLRVATSPANAAAGKFIDVTASENRLLAILSWAAQFASFEHMLLIDEADSFFWLDRIFLDLHSDTIGLAHTHPWLYWGGFDVDDQNQIVGPDKSGVILSANIVEELAILLQQDSSAALKQRSRDGVLAQLHALITTRIHNHQLKPMIDRRFGVSKERCQSSTLSVKGLSNSELKLMVDAVQAGESFSGHHPCLALTALSDDVVEELEIGGLMIVGLLVGSVLWFRRRRRKLVRFVVAISNETASYLRIRAMTGQRRRPSITEGLSNNRS